MDTNLNQTDTELKTAFLEHFNELPINVSKLHYAILAEDNDIVALSIRFFDTKEKIVSYIKEHIQVNENYQFFNYEYTVYLVTEDTVEIFRQDTDIREPDSFYKSILENEGVIIADNIQIQSYIEGNKEIIIDRPIAENPFNENELDQVEDRKEHISPDYNPYDPEWQGAAKELKFEAEQLVYELQPGDLKHVNELGNKLEEYRINIENKQIKEIYKLDIPEVDYKKMGNDKSLSFN